MEEYNREDIYWYVGNVKRCTNDNFKDIETTDLRGLSRNESTSEELESNPDIIMGRMMSGSVRRCFRLSELMLSFRETEDGFKFLDPDWKVPEPGEDLSTLIDPLTSAPIENTFSLRLVLGLYSMLRTYLQDRNISQPRRRSCEQLYEKVRQGLIEYIDYQASLDNEKKLFGDHPEWRNDLLILFTWLQLFSIWIRFWPGPGHEYAMVWEESEKKCDYDIRHTNVEVELSVYGMLMLQLEKNNQELYKLWNNLPYIHFDWSTGTITRPLKENAERLMGTHTIEGIINNVQHGNFCMAQASDYLSGTAFIYLTELLNVSRERMGDLMVYVMRLLYQYEKIALDSKMNSVKGTISVYGYDAVADESKRKLVDAIREHARILDVNSPGFVQPPPDFTKVNATGHLPQGMAEILGLDIQ